jgi:hypothetical protein
MWIGFTEEVIFHPDYLGYVGGRVEVYHSGEWWPYEYRFLTKHVYAFHWFRKYWEGRNVNQCEVNFVLWCVRTWFT